MTEDSQESSTERNYSKNQSYQQRAFENVKVEGDLNIRDIIQQIFIGGADKFEQKDNRSRLLILTQVKNEVDSRLEQSLHNGIIINLRKEIQPDNVKRPWDAEVRINNQQNKLLNPEDTIVIFFDQETISGKFLILGEPGVGKTTLMLRLARVLVKRAEKNVSLPIPILFNLSMWKNDKQTIAQWLVAELKDKYGVRKDIGLKLLQKHSLLPLLDGLDELLPSRQEKCVIAINHFLTSQERSLNIIICSRKEEYSNCETKLLLNSAIYIHSLTESQIQNYLTEINYQKNLISIYKKNQLFKLLKTPLFLNIILQINNYISIEEIQKTSTVKQKINYLLSIYIRQRLTNNIESLYYDNRVEIPSYKESIVWLTWLAHQMQRDKISEFMIEKIQPSWLRSRSEKLNYRIQFGSICGLIVGIFSGVANGMLIGIVTIIVYGVFFGVFFGGCKSKIRTVETLGWSRNRFLQTLNIFGSPRLVIVNE